MIDNVFYNPARLLFGREALAGMPGEIRRWGSRVLLVYGSGSVKQNGVYDQVTATLNEAGIPFVELGGVRANPLLGKVREGIELCKREHLDFILAVGGGSVIDTAKAISVGVANPGEVWDYFVKPGMRVTAAMPMGSVLTIPAAGSESSIGTVITNEDGQVKRALNNDIMIPKFAVLNPEFTFSLPPWPTACGIADILAHLLERYFTRVAHVDYTDALLEASMKTLMAYAPLALLHPEDYDIRAEIMLMGTIAHNNMLGIGRVGDWASHDIQHETSALFDVAHGAGLAVIFPAWMKYVSPRAPQRFAQFAVRVMGVPFGLDHEEELAQEAIRRLERFFASLGLPTRLGQLGIGVGDIGILVEKTFTDRERVGNFERLGPEDVHAIYHLALAES